MTRAEEIHHNIEDVEDLEEIGQQEIPVADVFRNLRRHPGQVITRWNWKSALLGAVVRASFYFTVYKASRESWLVTFTAVLVELSFRFFTTGVAGAIVQSFRHATPPWLATVIISISLPTAAHLIEFFTHYFQEKYFYDIFPAAEHSARQKTFAISVFFSVISAIFNLYMMRNGVLLVGAGDETQSLWKDIKKIPKLVSEFVLFLPDLLIRFVSEGKILAAVGVFFIFGFSVGAILGTTRGVWNWAWISALGAWGCLLAMTVGHAIIGPIRQSRRESRKVLSPPTPLDTKV